MATKQAPYEEYIWRRNLFWVYVAPVFMEEGASRASILMFDIPQAGVINDDVQCCKQMFARLPGAAIMQFARLRTLNYLPGVASLYGETRSNL